MSRDEPGFAGTTYHPPAQPEEDHPLWLALKIGLSMFLADLICSLIGFAAPTFAIITAAFLSVQPPQQSVGSAARKLVAVLVGASLGVAAAYGHSFLPANGIAATFAVIGLVGALLANRSSDYLFAVVVATVITFSAQSGEETVLVEALQGAATILIGCVVAPSVVWGVERLRAWRHERDRRAIRPAR